MTSFCSLCGEPVISHNSIPLPPIKARIFDLVHRHPGINAETLRTLVWASDPNGGPENPKVLHINDGLFPGTPQTWRFVEQ